jgi:hypothetical protein
MPWSKLLIRAQNELRSRTMATRFSTRCVESPHLDWICEWDKLVLSTSAKVSPNKFLATDAEKDRRIGERLQNPGFHD